MQSLNLSPPLSPFSPSPRRTTRHTTVQFTAHAPKLYGPHRQYKSAPDNPANPLHRQILNDKLERLASFSWQGNCFAATKIRSAM